MTGPPTQAFGADRIDERDGEKITRICPVSRAWQGRTAKTTVRAAHPGTAVAREERV